MGVNEFIVFKYSDQLTWNINTLVSFIDRTYYKIPTHITVVPIGNLFSINKNIFHQTSEMQ